MAQLDILSIVTDSAVKLIMGALGIILLSLFQSRAYIMQTENVSISKLYKDYNKAGFWSLSVIFTLTLILAIEPEANEFLRTALGLDLANTTIGFLMLGMVLTKSFDKSSTKKETSAYAVALKNIEVNEPEIVQDEPEIVQDENAADK
jgi:hypothetical protein